MKEFTYVIKEELGLHARPAGLLVKEAKKFQSATTLAAKGKTAAAGKLIAIMSIDVYKRQVLANLCYMYIIRLIKSYNDI